MTPPLRFLVAVIAGWACARAAVLAPWPADGEAPSVPARADRAEAGAGAPTAAVPSPSVMHPVPDRAGSRARHSGAAPVVGAGMLRLAVTAAANSGGTLPAYVSLNRSSASTFLPSPSASIDAASVAPAAPGGFGAARDQPTAAPSRGPSRWSFSAWALARRGGSPALASGGTLGASQAGARIGYRIIGPATAPMSLTARLTSPARSLSGTEVAVGVEWQPSQRLPVRLAAERRQALGGDGRSAFALLAHGGVTDLPVAGGFRLDAYGQAGVLGARSRDLFADGTARLTLPLDRRARLSLGAGAWAAAQPGVSRVDVGPSATFRVHGTSVTLDWRARVAGSARPASGPAVTVSTSF